MSQSSKFKQSLDSIEVSVNDYLIEYDEHSFRSSGIADDEMDLLNIDQDLLNAAVFHEMNYYRRKKRRVQLKYDSCIQKVVTAYCDYYSGGSFRKTERNGYKSRRSAKYAAKHFGYYGAYVQPFYGNPELIDLHMFSEFHFKRSEADSSSLGLFHGARPEHGDTIQREEMHAMTYAEFAKHVAKNWFRGNYTRHSKSRAFTEMAVEVRVDERSLFKHRIPQAKVFLVMGGRQTLLLPDTEEYQEEHYQASLLEEE